MEEKYKGITIEDSASATSKEIFQIRKTYNDVFPKDVAVYDFNDGKNIAYGRLDHDHNAIHANEFYLKQLNSSKSDNLLCLNFVADAFEDLRYAIKEQYIRRLKQDNFFTTDWDAERAWSSPHGFYENRMLDIQRVFVKGNLFLKSNKDKIKNIDDFLATFFNDFYPSMGKKMPITKSGIILSKYYNPSSTGLCIEISSENAGADSVKFEKFIKSPNFEFYLLAAAEYGFLVDKNCPWRLVANINSPKMQQYMSLYDLSIENVFDTCFVKTYKYDIQNLKVYLKQMYESFLAISPNFIEKKPVAGTVQCPVDLQKSISAIPRQKITETEYQQKFGDLFWLKIYYRVKLDEISVMQSNFLLTKELQRIEEVYNYLDFDQTLDYVNDRIKSQTS